MRIIRKKLFVSNNVENDFINLNTVLSWWNRTAVVPSVIKLNQSQSGRPAVAFPDRLIRNNSCRERPVFNISQLPQPPISVSYHESNSPRLGDNLVFRDYFRHRRKCQFFSLFARFSCQNMPVVAALKLLLQRLSQQKVGRTHERDENSIIYSLPMQISIFCHAVNSTIISRCRKFQICIQMRPRCERLSQACIHIHI